MKEDLGESSAVDDADSLRPLGTVARQLGRGPPRLPAVGVAGGARRARRADFTQAQVVDVADVADTMNIAPSAGRLGGRSLTS